MRLSLSWLSGPTRSRSTCCALKAHPLRNCRQQTVRKLMQPKPITACPNIWASKLPYHRSLGPRAFDSLRKPLWGFRSE
jgi:hypothetical protein